MIKRLCLIILVCFPFFSAIAQGDVIVLVDVSRSIQQSHFIEARSVVKNMLLGNPINNSNFVMNLDPRSSLKIGEGIPLVAKGKKIIIFPFGESWRINHIVDPKVIDTPSDISTYFDNNYPRQVSDQKTYLELSKAKMAQIAKSQGIEEYILVLVSDNVHDDYGGSNARPQYTAVQKALLDNFNTASNPYVDIKQGTIDFIDEELYKISIFSADITSWNPPPPPPPGIDSTVTKACQIRLTSFANGKKGREKEVKNNPVTFRWSAKNYPKGTKFTITIRSTTGNNKNNVSKLTTSNSFQTKLADDSYRVSVSSPICAPTTTYIKVKTEKSGGGFLFLLLILGLLGGIGYWLYKRRQEDSIRKLSSNTTGGEEVHYQEDNNQNNSTDELDGF